MAKKIRVITDSCCRFSEQEQEKLCISSISSRIQIGNQIIRELENNNTDELGNFIDKNNIIPVVYPPTPQELFQMYSMIYSEFDYVISIHLSSAISTIFKEAKTAQSLLYDTHIEVIDSKLTEAGLQILTRKIAGMSSKQIPFQTILTHLQNSDSYFASYVFTDQPSFLKKNVDPSFNSGFSFLKKNNYNLISLSGPSIRQINKSSFTQLQINLTENVEPLLPSRPINVDIYHGLDIEKAKAIENVVNGKLLVKSTKLHPMPLSSMCRYGTRSVLVCFSFLPDNFVLELKADQ
ncbi:MAG: DegV family protein [Caldisericia bacterium]|nr:DegV family protein [Caldisericia bacterium]